jgi:hypothetical protein
MNNNSIISIVSFICLIIVIISSGNIGGSVAAPPADRVRIHYENNHTLIGCFKISKKIYIYTKFIFY